MSELLSRIQNDEHLYTSLLTSKGKGFRLEIPVVSELYNHLSDSVFRTGVNDLDNLPIFDCKNLQAGVYKTLNDKIIALIDIPKGTLKYHTFFATKHFRESKVADLVEGKYLVSFCFESSDQLHLIPEGFTYLILDIDQNDVIPFHAIENSLPQDLSIYWVFFAMKKLKDDLFPSLDISKSFDEKEEAVLKDKGYL